MFPNSAIIGVGQSAYTRRPAPGQSTQSFMRDAVVAGLKDSALDANDIQGLAVAWRWPRCRLPPTPPSTSRGSSACRCAG